MLAAELPGWRNTIKQLEPTAIAAASIGQVHRSVLAGGQPVAVKIQYRRIDRIIEADLVNLRRLLKSLFALFTDANFEPIFFLPDGRVIVYDFGCVKSVPPNIVDGYRVLCRAALEGRCGDVLALLAAMGVTTASGALLRRGGGCWRRDSLRFTLATPNRPESP